MSLRRSFSREATGTRGVPPDPALPAPLSDVELCERAVQAIWRSLDEHELIDEDVRDELAMVLEPLTALPLGPRAQRLIGLVLIHRRFPSQARPSRRAFCF